MFLLSATLKLSLGPLLIGPFFCHLFDFAILSIVKLICEEFCPLASNFYLSGTSTLFICFCPPLTIAEFWLSIL